jgi:hypothetical protein
MRSLSQSVPDIKGQSEYTHERARSVLHVKTEHVNVRLAKEDEGRWQEMRHRSMKYVAESSRSSNLE